MLRERKFYRPCFLGKKSKSNSTQKEFSSAKSEWAKYKKWYYENQHQFHKLNAFEEYVVVRYIIQETNILETSKKNRKSIKFFQECKAFYDSNDGFIV